MGTGNSIETRIDPVARMVKDLTAEEVVNWMIESHGLSENSRNTVTFNLKEQFKWHRLQGRLDRRPFWIFMAELLRIRRTSPLGPGMPVDLQVRE